MLKSDLLRFVQAPYGTFDRYDTEMKTVNIQSIRITFVGNKKKKKQEPGQGGNYMTTKLKIPSLLEISTLEPKFYRKQSNPSIFSKSSEVFEIRKGEVCGIHTAFVCN